MKKTLISLLSIIVMLSFFFLWKNKVEFKRKKSQPIQEINDQNLNEILKNKVYPKLGTIQILPLGNVDKIVIDQVTKTINSFYNRPVKLLPTQKLIPKLKRNTSPRYSADSILSHFKSNTYTIVVTEVDITQFKKEKKSDWGIFGLGYQPGRICVISYCPCRLGKNISKNVMLTRVHKVTIHELGHNFGLPHCENDKRCVMHAAEGKGVQVDYGYDEFCIQCKRALKKMYN